MSKENTFIPHVWGENIEKKENDSNITDLFNQLSENSSEEVAAGIEDNLFDEILNRVEHDAVEEPDLVMGTSLDEEDNHVEAGEGGDEQSYTQGFMDGVSKQREDTEEELMNATQMVVDIAESVGAAKVELDKTMESAIKNYVTNVAKNVLGDIFNENMHSIISQRLESFVSENNLFDYEITVDVNEIDHKMFEVINESNISFGSSNGLKRGQAHLVAKKEQQRFEAEFDLYDSLEKQVEAL
ncbi:FliH/SctL family protein [Vibrio crassostreae]|uniref:FliH/SctL family protein n=1 Tax=Vibrio crassostreae TaxID=246167 RepID=UPI001B30B0A6|nr:FliH/SctL family protein [Vibrio crassostreae]